MPKITADNVWNAIRRYDEGVRPFRHTKPRSWYLIGKQDRAYPLKYIYALATNQTPNSFNTSEPKREFGRLNFDIKREPKDYEADF